MYDAQFKRKMQRLKKDVVDKKLSRQKLVDKLRKYLIRRSLKDYRWMSLDTRHHVSNLFDEALEYIGEDPISMFELSKDPKIYHSSI